MDTDLKGEGVKNVESESEDPAEIVVENSFVDAGISVGHDCHRGAGRFGGS